MCARYLWYRKWKIGHEKLWDELQGKKTQTSFTWSTATVAFHAACKVMLVASRSAVHTQLHIEKEQKYTTLWPEMLCSLCRCKLWQCYTPSSNSVTVPETEGKKFTLGDIFPSNNLTHTHNLNYKWESSLQCILLCILFCLPCTSFLKIASWQETIQSVNVDNPNPIQFKKCFESSGKRLIVVLEWVMATIESS